MKRTAKKKLPKNVMTLWEVLERHSDQQFQFADDEKGGPCWHLLQALTEAQADGLIWVEENNDDSAAVWSLRGDDSWEPDRMFLNIFPPRRKREATEIRQAIKARELFGWCSDRWMNAFSELGDPMRVHCDELLKDANASPEDVTLYITRYEDDTIAVNAMFIGHCGCWLPGEFLGTIEAKVRGVEELV